VEEFGLLTTMMELAPLLCLVYLDEEMMRMHMNILFPISMSSVDVPSNVGEVNIQVRNSI
jgi:hypothetical protein